jgi:hypothetical protein
MEEAFFNVTNRLNENAIMGEAEMDPAVAELMLIATEIKMNLMKSDSHAGARRNTFSLGLGDFMEGTVEGLTRRATVDLNTIAARRRSSRLSELSMAGKGKGGDQPPPNVFLSCDVHGVERFFLGDLRCCACEREAFESETQREKQARVTFKKFDEDGSGSLDMNEMRVLLRELLGAKVKAEEMDEVMQSLDHSGDGQVDEEEFVVWWTSRRRGGLGQTLKRN